MKDVIKFLFALQKNNNREWFNEHKHDYLEAQGVFNNFAEKLIAGIASFDESVAGNQLKDCTYRIYRDTRFSPDKSPYKSHIGAFVCPGGKKSGFSGYYFQVGPGSRGEAEGILLATGNYQFDTKTLQVLRDDISQGDGDFEETLKQAPLFSLDDSDMLKRVPNGFPKDAEYSKYLMYRSYCLMYYPDKNFIEGNDLLERTIDAFRSTYPFLQYLNRAIAYTME